VPVAGRIRHLDLDACDPPAVFDHEVYLIAGLRAPEVQPAAGHQGLVADTQMLIDVA
jgi:hypothetical protein